MAAIAGPLIGAAISAIGSIAGAAINSSTEKRRQAMQQQMNQENLMHQEGINARRVHAEQLERERWRSFEERQNGIKQAAQQATAQAQAGANKTIAEINAKTEKKRIKSQEAIAKSNDETQVKLGEQSTRQKEIEKQIVETQEETKHRIAQLQEDGQKQRQRDAIEGGIMLEEVKGQVQRQIEEARKERECAVETIKKETALKLREYDKQIEEVRSGAEVVIQQSKAQIEESKTQADKEIRQEQQRMDSVLKEKEIQLKAFEQLLNHKDVAKADEFITAAVGAIFKQQFGVSAMRV